MRCENGKLFFLGPIDLYYDKGLSFDSTQDDVTLNEVKVLEILKFLYIELTSASLFQTLYTVINQILYIFNIMHPETSIVYN